MKNNCTNKFEDSKFFRNNTSWVKDDLMSPTGKGIRIGVVDSGWDRTLTVPRIKKGAGFVDPQNELAFKHSDDDHDRIGHGTACADLILQIAPKSEVYPIRVFGHRLETSIHTIQAALNWAIDHRLRLVNLSLGTLLSDSLRSFYATCELAKINGLIIVASTHIIKGWSFPSIFENVIGVAAGEFSNPLDYYYRKEDGIECVAKGEQHVLWLGGQRMLKQGTSFAAPNITGIVALLLERYPSATLEDVRELLGRYALNSESYEENNRLN